MSVNEIVTVVTSLTYRQTYYATKDKELASHIYDVERPRFKRHNNSLNTIITKDYICH